MSQKFSERDSRGKRVLPDTLPAAWASYSARTFRGWTPQQLRLAETIFMGGVATAYNLLIQKALKSGGHVEAARDLLIEMADWVGKRGRANGSKL